MRFPRASGILLPPTSLPGDFGIGDFGPEAFKFVDFLAASRQTYLRSKSVALLLTALAFENLEVGFDFGPEARINLQCALNLNVCFGFLTAKLVESTDRLIGSFEVSVMTSVK